MMKPDLKVVGEIKPPDFKDPVTMLRNITSEIEQGLYGKLDTIVVAVYGENGLELFGGGPQSGMEHCAFLFAAGASRLHKIPSED